MWFWLRLHNWTKEQNFVLFFFKEQSFGYLYMAVTHFWFSQITVFLSPYLLFFWSFVISISETRISPKQASIMWLAWTNIFTTFVQAYPCLISADLLRPVISRLLWVKCLRACLLAYYTSIEAADLKMCFVSVNGMWSTVCYQQKLKPFPSLHPGRAVIEILGCRRVIGWYISLRSGLWSPILNITTWILQCCTMVGQQAPVQS